MRESRDTAKEIGARLLPPGMVDKATIPYLLTTFDATGLSEQERLEVAFMLQKFIIEGVAKGVNVPGLMERRAKVEGRLHFGFNDSDIPSANSITFDRGSWRSMPDSSRMKEFINRVGTRLGSREFRQGPQRRVRTGASRFRGELPRTGPLKSPVARRALDHIASRVSSAFSSRLSEPVFQNLAKFQGSVGVRPPAPVAAPRHRLEAFDLQQSTAMSEVHDRNTFQTRQDMMRTGVNPLSMDQRGVRSGIASPRPVQGGVLEKTMAGAAAGGRPQRLLLYTGPGTWGSEIQEVKENAAAIGVQVDAVSSLSGVDYSKYAAIVWPGGNATTQHSAISSSEISRLKQAINGGLNYLGHCAGAFIAGTWGRGFGLAPGVPGVQNTGIIGKQETFKFGNFGTRTTTFFGGPTDLSVYGGTPLATYADGSVSMTALDFGQGKVIVTSGHPSVERGNDSEPDDDIHQQLLRAVVAGTLPGQAPTTGPGSPPGDSPTGNIKLPDVNVKTGDTNITMSDYDIDPTQVVPGGVQVGSQFGSRGRGGGFRKTPVAKPLPEGMVNNTFTSQLQGILHQASPMLHQLAGALQGLKP